MCAGHVGHLALMKAACPLLRSLGPPSLPVLARCARPLAPVPAGLFRADTSPSALVIN